MSRINSDFFRISIPVNFFLKLNGSQLKNPDIYSYTQTQCEDGARDVRVLKLTLVTWPPERISQMIKNETNFGIELWNFAIKNWLFNLCVGVNVGGHVIHFTKILLELWVRWISFYSSPKKVGLKVTGYYYWQVWLNYTYF